MCLVCPPVSKCAHHAPCTACQPIFSFDCQTPLIIYTKNIFIFYNLSPVDCFFYTNLPDPYSPPSFATPAVSQPERRNVRLDGCSSGNVPFQSAFAPEISSLIPLRPIPAKTGIWWEGNVVGLGGWGGVRYSWSIKDGAREEGKCKKKKEKKKGEYCR